MKFIVPREYVWTRFFKNCFYRKWMRISRAILEKIGHIAQQKGHPLKNFSNSLDANEITEVNQEIDRLFEETYSDFENELALSILTSYYGTIVNDLTYQKLLGMGVDIEIPPLSASLYDKYQKEFREQKQSLKTQIAKKLGDGNAKSMREEIQETLAKELSVFDGIITQAKNDAFILAYQFLNRFERKQYGYRAQDGACDRCKRLHGQNFYVDDFQPGVNAPRMHPNCKCNIGRPWTKGSGGGIPELACTWLGILTTTPIGDLLSRLNHYPGMKDLSPVNIGSKTYQAALGQLQNVMLRPDGTLLNPNVATEYDKMLLDLMRRRDETTDFSEKNKLTNQALEIMNDQRGRYSVDFFKPYNYYIVDEDVTDRLNSLLKDTVEKYRPQFEKLQAPYPNSFGFLHPEWSKERPGYTAENLLKGLNLFRSIVQNSGELDLKNQNDWQKSGYIYDGEIVDQDALGNIAYGYMGKAMGLNDLLLLTMAGAAQKIAGTSDADFDETYGDDPRDQFRIEQGMELFGKI